MDGGAIHVGVHGIEAQAVEVIIAQPHDGVVAEEAADFVAACVFEVDGVSPGRVVQVGEVWAEFGEVISRRAKVVVDDVEQHCESVFVAGVYESLQCFRAAVGFMRGEEVDAVVSPASFSGKCVDRHEFNVGNAEVSEVGEVILCSVECAFRCKCADVEFVDDGAWQRRCLPLRVCPRKAA